MRQMIQIPGPSELVYIARFTNVKGWWLIVEGDPTVGNWRDYLGAIKLHKNRTQVGETYYSGGSADQIAELREVPNRFCDWRDEPRAFNVEVAPDDHEAARQIAKNA